MKKKKISKAHIDISENAGRVYKRAILINAHNYKLIIISYIVQIKQWYK